jgi:hypothetical protein
MPSLGAWIAQVNEQAAFDGGRQQDAAECLMHILLSVDQGRMQQRVCGANAAAAVASMVMCAAQDAAQISRDAPPINIAELLVASLTDDQAIASVCEALIVRVENIYEAGDEYFSVDAQADWSNISIPLSLRNRPNVQATYRVAGFVAHMNSPDF